MKKNSSISKSTIGITIGAIAAAAGILIIWLFYENDKKEKKIRDLQNEINENQNLTIEIRKRLTDLIQNNKDVDPEVANELGHIVALLEIKQDTSAVLKLAKIIENLLNELYGKDSELKELAKKNGRRKAVFADLLEFAKNKNVISNEDFHLLSVLKIIRNEEAHDLDIHKEKSRVLAAFIAGLGLVILLSLKKKLKKEKAEQAQ